MIGTGTVVGGRVVGGSVVGTDDVVGADEGGRTDGVAVAGVKDGSSPRTACPPVVGGVAEAARSTVGTGARPTTAHASGSSCVARSKQTATPSSILLTRQTKRPRDEDIDGIAGSSEAVWPEE